MIKIDSEIILKLAKHLEPELVGIALEHNLVEFYHPIDLRKDDFSNTHKFKNIQLTDKGIKKLKIKNVIVTEEYAKKINNLFPTGKKGNFRIIQKKAQWFFNNHNYDLQFIYNFIKSYIEKYILLEKSKYIFAANNIFSKMESNRFRKVPILELIKESENNLNVKNDNSNKIITIKDELDL